MYQVVLATAVLAQRRAGDDRLGATLLWLGVLTLAVLVFGVVLMVLRKRLNDTKPTNRDLPFTLADLRQMYREGQLSDEEFDRAKQRIIALSTGEGADEADEATDADDLPPTDEAHREEGPTPGPSSKG